MKKAYSLKNDIFFFISLFILMLFSCVISFLSFGNKNVAHAYSAPTVTSMTAVASYGVNDSGEITRSRGAYDGTGYAKGVQITFDLGGADYYRIDTTKSGEAEIEGTITPAMSAEYIYPVNIDGVVTVRLSTFDDTQALIGSVERTVKCDDISPTASGTSMTEWMRSGTTYNAAFAISSFEDNLNTLGKVYYRVNDGEVKEADTDSAVFIVPVTDNSDITVYWFDRAGNSFVDVSHLDKYDDVPPHAPTVTVTPNVDTASSSGYARFYTVSIDYHGDTGSGLKDAQTYLLNGEQFVYHGPFDINTARDHVIRATGEDRVGNSSVASTVNISVATFDVTEPVTSDFTLDIDVRRDNICVATVTVVDGQSGVKSVRIEDGPTFADVGQNRYRATVDILHAHSSTLLSEDAVGNVGRKVVLVDFADNGQYYSAKIRSYADKYRLIDFGLYADGAIEEINNAYSALNTVVLGLIIGGDFDKVGFDNACDRIDKAIEADGSTYVVNESSTYLSGMLTYEIDYADFAFYKKGEDIKLVFDAAGVDNSYVSKSGFSKGFCDAFSIRLYRNGTEVTDALERGVKIALAMPSGYYERQYALFFGEEKIETACVNNKIEFTLKKGGRYDLVVSGDTTKRGSEEGRKYITVFGHKLSYGVFFGTVFGVTGATVIVVVILIAVSKRSKRREYY